MFLTAAALALLVLPHLRLDLMPGESDHHFTVSYAHWNSTPDMVEDQVTSVLENALSRVSGLNKITSVSGYGYGQIQLDFSKNTDLSVKQFEITSIIRQIYPRLPANTSYPVIIPAKEENDESRTPALIYSIQAPEQPFLIRQTVEETIVEKLSGMTGLQDVSLTGTEPLQLVIRFDDRLCRTLHIAPADIATALQTYFAEAYPGVIEQDGHPSFIRIRAPATSIIAIEQIIVSTDHPGIRIRDVAKVSLEEQEPQSYFRIDGQNAIHLGLYVRKNENALVVAGQLKQMINTLGAGLPAGYRTTLSYDDTEFLRKEIHKNFQRGILSIGILSVFIFLAYRNWRYLLILSCALLVNTCNIILLAYAFQIDIHIYTIAGIAIVFGIMTDNGIIVLDYCHRSYGREIFPALLSATATIVAALSLIFFLPEGEARNLYDFSLIIILGLVSSMIISIVFIPGLYKLVFHTPVHREWAGRKKKLRWLKLRNGYGKAVGAMARYRPVLIVAVILLFGTPVFLLPAGVGNRTYRREIRPYVDKWLGGTLRLFVKGLHERYGYRNMEKTKLFVDAELPAGSTLGQMNGVMTGLDAYLRNIQGIDTYVTNVYSGRYGSMVITFSEGKERSSLPYRIKTGLIGYVQDLGGAEFSITGVGEGFGSGAEEEETPIFTVVMKGYDYDELERQANILGQMLSRQERVEKINLDDRQDRTEKKSKEYTLDLDADRMAQAHTDKISVLNGLRDRTMPSSSFTVLPMDGHLYPVLLQEVNSNNYSSFDLLNNYVMPDSQRVIRVREVGRIRLQTTAGAIHREDRQYIRNVSFSFIGSFQLGNDILDTTLQEMQRQLPLGFSAKKAIFSENAANGWQPYVLILVLFAMIYFISGMLFESLKRPFAILVAIPVSFIGIFLTFFAGGFFFDQGGYAAFVMLGGLVANASIFMISDVIRFQKKAKGNKNRAMIKAVFVRGRTILLTILATCCGLTPYLLDGSQEAFWFSFAIGTIGGLLFSLFSLFFFLPVLLWEKKRPSIDRSGS